MINIVFNELTQSLFKSEVNFMLIYELCYLNKPVLFNNSKKFNLKVLNLIASPLKDYFKNLCRWSSYPEGKIQT